MGLVTRRSDQLDKLFENLAIDPKKAQKEKNATAKQTDKKKSKSNKD
ncbi:SPJ_0845 family protein [uncultured Limosilactobacillus sp.]|nr:SPJ_0845 family protein [uncultured Limosilactobacillus sp.]